MYLPGAAAGTGFAPIPPRARCALAVASGLWQHSPAVSHRRPVNRKRSRRRAAGTRERRWLRSILLLGLGIIVAFGLTAFVLLDHRVRTEFGQTQGRLPAHVYTQPLDLYGGRLLAPAVLRRHLHAVGYRQVDRPLRSGEYSVRGHRFDIHARAFRHADADEPARRLTVHFDNDRVTSVRDDTDGAAIARIEPERIGSIYPGRAADRILLRLEDVPAELVAMLLAVEDRRFFEHRGIRPAAVVRALIANIRAGRTVQGGSTLTQQLAKNFFLGNQQTIGRKFSEALMALSMEWHFAKDQILEAYLNEVYLGQDGRRSIHGFGLGARYWFNRPLEELERHELALLVGLIRGPSYYDARRHPQRARHRRDTVLRVMAGQGMITADTAAADSERPLAVVAREDVRLTAYPAYVDLVRRQLAQHYDEADLRVRGLRIFTHLDPVAQAAAEAAVSKRLTDLDPGGDSGLQAAAVLVESATGAVVAVVGDRDPRQAGFNRALDADRQIGSLAKPAIYLAALRNPGTYTLISPLDDSPLVVDLDGGREWRPRNFDGEFGGTTALIDALAASRNVAAVRLGLDLGLDRAGATLADLGVPPPRRLYPSDLLGAFGRTPLEVAAMYQTLAADGFDAPLSAIAAVQDHSGEPLSRHTLRVRQAVEAAPVFLVRRALEQVVIDGTGRGLQGLLPGRRMAGKTGSTDDLRDSWFAGFDGRHTGVVWVGRDDNAPAGLSGAAGALRVWADMMRDLPAVPLRDNGPAGIEWAYVDAELGRSLPEHCREARRLPFLAGSVPARQRQCRADPEPPTRR